MEYDPSEYIELFYEEADEYIETMTEALLRLEKHPQDHGALEEVFRGAHSFKGGCAAVGLTDISEFAHHMENVLQKLRDKEIAINSSIVDTLFQSFDILKNMIAAQQADENAALKQKILNESKKMVKVLDALQGGGATVAETSAAEAVTGLALSDEEIINADELKNSGNKLYEIIITLEKDAPMISARVFLICNNLGRSGEIIKCYPDIEDQAAEIGEQVSILFAGTISEKEISSEIDIGSVTGFDIKEVDDLDDYRITPAPGQLQQMEQLLEVMSEQEDKVREEASAKTTEIKKSTVRMDIEKLDNLLNLVAELVINRGQAIELGNQLLGYTTKSEKMNDLYEIIVAQGMIINQFQESIMTARLVPIGQVFQRFPRIVRDLARDRGKDVQLEIVGEETELDKKIIDEIGEPLTHLVRNSIDHGLETVEERKKAGKPTLGIVKFSAYHEGNNIIISVKDDGRGIDVEKVKQKALEKEMATEDELAKLTDKEIIQFILQPGFSTAEKVSDISGRGVGMDVVCRKVEALNGELEVSTEPGKGSTFSLKLPLTLAIIQALLIAVADEKYAIPIACVVETIRITEKDIYTVAGKGKVIKVRDEIITLLNLEELLDVNTNGRAKKERNYVAVVSVGDHQVALMADKMISEQEIVIKSLDSTFKKAEYLAGASILGDGSVCLILDTSALVLAADA